MRSEVRSAKTDADNFWLSFTYLLVHLYLHCVIPSLFPIDSYGES